MWGSKVLTHKKLDGQRFQTVWKIICWRTLRTGKVNAEPASLLDLFLDHVTSEDSITSDMKTGVCILRVPNPWQNRNLHPGRHRNAELCIHGCLAFSIIQLWLSYSLCGVSSQSVQTRQHWLDKCVILDQAIIDPFHPWLYNYFRERFSSCKSWL